MVRIGNLSGIHVGITLSENRYDCSIALSKSLDFKIHNRLGVNALRKWLSIPIHNPDGSGISLDDLICQPLILSMDNYYLAHFVMGVFYPFEIHTNISNKQNTRIATTLLG